MDDTPTTSNNSSTPMVDNTTSTTPATSQNLISPINNLSGTSRGIQNLGGDNIFSDAGNGRIVVTPTTVPQVLMGNQNVFGEGFYVTKPGVDVTKNADPSQFIFNSNQDTFKIVKTATVSFPINYSAGLTNFTIPHNLGYVPVYLVYLFFSDSYFLLPYLNPILEGTPPTGTIVIGTTVVVDADDTNLIISWYEGDATGNDTVTFKYFLLQESITP